MELEQFKADLLNVINHYGKTVNIGVVYYVVKDVFRDVSDAYEGWLNKQQTTTQPQPDDAEKQEPAEAVEGEVED